MCGNFLVLKVKPHIFVQENKTYCEYRLDKCLVFFRQCKFKSLPISFFNNWTSYKRALFFNVSLVCLVFKFIWLKIYSTTFFHQPILPSWMHVGVNIHVLTFHSIFTTRYFLLATPASSWHTPRSCPAAVIHTACSRAVWSLRGHAFTSAWALHVYLGVQTTTHVSVREVSV